MKKCQHDFVGDPFAMNYLKFRITDSSTWWWALLLGLISRIVHLGELRMVVQKCCVLSHCDAILYKNSRWESEEIHTLTWFSRVFKGFQVWFIPKYAFRCSSHDMVFTRQSHPLPPDCCLDNRLLSCEGRIVWQQEAEETLRSMSPPDHQAPLRAFVMANNLVGLTSNKPS
jgi:hypothetical protein